MMYLIKLTCLPLLTYMCWYTTIIVLQFPANNRFSSMEGSEVLFHRKFVKLVHQEVGINYSC